MSAVDVAILGSGVAAWACAAALLGSGLSCAVLARDSGWQAVGEYLPPEGVSAMAALGLGTVLEHPAHRRSPGVLSLWGPGPPLRQDVLFLPGGRAFCLDRTRLEHDLRTTALDAGVVEVAVTGLPALSGGPGAWHLGTVPRVAARFLIDATGRAASLSRALGASVARQDRLTGLALFCEGAPVADGALRVEGLANGWCYAAPLSGDRLVAVFLTEADLLPRGSAQRAALARAALAQSRLVGPLLPSGSLRADFRGMPAGGQWTVPCCGSGWAAIGDATAAFDPLASAGLTKVFLDIREVQQVITSGSFPIAATRQARLAGYRRELRSAYDAETRFAGPFWIRRRDAPQGGPAQSP